MTTIESPEYVGQCLELAERVAPTPWRIIVPRLARSHKALAEKLAEVESERDEALEMLREASADYCMVSDSLREKLAASEDENRRLREALSGVRPVNHIHQSACEVERRAFDPEFPPTCSCTFGRQRDMIDAALAPEEVTS